MLLAKSPSPTRPTPNIHTYLPSQPATHHPASATCSLSHSSSIVIVSIAPCQSSRVESSRIESTWFSSVQLSSVQSRSNHHERAFVDSRSSAGSFRRGCELSVFTEKSVSRRTISPASLHLMLSERNHAPVQSFFTKGDEIEKNLSDSSHGINK